MTEKNYPEPIKLLLQHYQMELNAREIDLEALEGTLTQLKDMLTVVPAQKGHFLILDDLVLLSDFIDPQPLMSYTIYQMNAALKGSDRLHLLTHLVSLGADVNVTNQKGWSPLFCATNSKAQPLVSYLLEQGAKPDHVLNNGTPLLSIAVTSPELMAFLIDHAPLNHQDLRGFTALHRCASLHGGYLESALLLLKAGADPNMQNQKGLTPLHYAVREGNHGLIEALISHGADANVLDHEGRSAFDFTEQSGTEGLFDFLKTVIERAALNTAVPSGQAHFALPMTPVKRL